MRNSTIRVELPLLKFLGAGWYSGFQVMGMIGWGQKSKPKKSLGLPTNPSPHPKETMDQKLYPRKSHSKYLSLIKWFCETGVMYYVKKLILNSRKTTQLGYAATSTNLQIVLNTPAPQTEDSKFLRW